MAPDSAAGIPYEDTDCTPEEAVEAVEAVRATAAGEVGARTGQRLMLTRGPNRLIGRVSSDSVTWITLRLDTGCSLAVDLDGWTLSPEPQRPESPARKLWRLAVGEIRRAR